MTAQSGLTGAIHKHGMMTAVKDFATFEILEKGATSDNEQLDQKKKYKNVCVGRLVNMIGPIQSMDWYQIGERLKSAGSHRMFGSW